MRISTPARIIGAAVLALGLTAPVTAAPLAPAPRAAIGADLVGDVHFRQLSARIIPDSTGLIDLMIATTGDDAIAFDVTGYVQRTRSKANDYALSLRRAKAVKAYMRAHGVTLPIRVHGARVPAHHGGRWDARRATVQVIRDLTPALTTLITTEWGTPDADIAAFHIVNPGAWTNSPDAYEFKWQYKFTSMADWADIVNGDNPMGTLQSYSTSTAYTDSVTMERTSVYNYLQACGYVRGFVRASNRGSWSPWYQTETLLPQGCVA